MTRRRLVLHMFYGLSLSRVSIVTEKKNCNFFDAGARRRVCDRGDVYLNKIGEALVV